LLDRHSDQSGGYLTGDDYFMIPAQPLANATTYTATMTGTDTQGYQFSKTWSFTTIPNATIVNPIPFQATATSIWIQWDTAGPVDPNSQSLQYGTTTAYGTKLTPAPNNPNDKLAVAVNLTGLAANTTYHYLITATDAQGVMANSGDLTFTTPAQ
jgi:Purple acid Phosphatase, N-terminal domain